MKKEMPEGRGTSDALKKERNENEEESNVSQHQWLNIY